MSSAKLYLAIPFSRKDELKRMFRLKWDATTKMWMAPTQTVYNNEHVRPFHIITLGVLYDHKDAAKVLGAKWNGTQWYVSRQVYGLYRDEWKRFQGGDREASDELNEAC
jgi:hypothetical protein